MRTFSEGFRAYITANLSILLNPHMIIVGEKKKKKKRKNRLDNSISLSLHCVNPYVLFSFPMGVVSRYCLHSCFKTTGFTAC